MRVDGASAGRSRDSDGASSTQSFGGGGGADTGTPVKRVNNGPAVMGAESHRVVINAATMKINFPDRRNPAGTTIKWNTPMVRKWFKRNEGTADKCPAAARLLALATYFRTVLCPYANTPGHMHPGDTAHKFPSSPWETPNGPAFATRL